MLRQFKVKVNSKDYHVEVEEVSREIATSPVADMAKKKMENAVTRESSSKKKKAAITFAAGAMCELKAPLPGVIADIFVKEKQTVHAGDKILVLEAMKMENAILAPASGKIESIAVKSGDSVLGNQILLTIIC
jgi:glutaconyl-CoA/methylmalonyl-CoA decarboxylase subunit gamma